MTVFSAANSAAIRVTGVELTALFSNPDQIAMEFRDLINETAADIAKSFDWRDLTRVATFDGDGGTTIFPKPSDFDRMLVSADDQRNWFWGYFPFATVSEFLRWRNSNWGQVSPGGWIIMGGAFEFQPAPVGGATFPYISRMWSRADDGTEKPEFTSDTDTFALSERLLTLGLIWRYRAQKGVDYSEDMANYEGALAQAQSRDAGAQMIRSRPYINRSRVF